MFGSVVGTEEGLQRDGWVEAEVEVVDMIVVDDIAVALVDIGVVVVRWVVVVLLIMNCRYGEGAGWKSREFC
jgi:hypothetical protein